MGGGSNTSSGDAPVNSPFKRRMKKLGIKKKQEEQRAIEDFRRQMNFPAEVERTSSMNIGSSSQSTDEEISTSNKSNTYNRNSKRGTRLVRSR